MSASELLRWLEAIPDQPDPLPDHKRRRREDLQTPPTSHSGLPLDGPMDDSGGPGTPKRQKTTADPEKTPTARSDPAHRPLQSAASSETDSASQSQTSSSHASSRKRRRRIMEIGRDRVEVVSFASASDPSLFSKHLVDLLADFDAVNGNRKPYVSLTRKEDLESVWNLKGKVAMYFAPSAGKEGEIAESQESPSLSDVHNIMRTAEEYTVLEQDEAGWNSGVHHPLLRLALPHDKRVGITPCTTARIHPEYMPFGAQNRKKVDFCLTIDPLWPNFRPSTTPALRAINGLCRNLPGLSINHSEFRPVCEKPIVVSIETKRASTHVDESHLQLGIWQAAHWNLLEKLASKTATGDINFLPSIYVVGHEWKFSAATRASGDTAIWTGCSMGSTESILGIYRIVWCLRRLARYSTEVYWPWFETRVLPAEQVGQTT